MTKNAPIRAINPRIVVPEDSVPVGQYPGLWKGYIVAFECRGARYECRTQVGFRMISTPCMVTVDKNGRITVEAKLT